MTPKELMAEVIAEAAMREQMEQESPYGAMPHFSPSKSLGFRQLGESALPYLVEMLAEERPERWPAYDVLRTWGLLPRSALDALAAQATANSLAAAVLYVAAPDRALALRLHERPANAERMLIAASGPLRLALLHRLLESSDDTQVQSAFRQPIRNRSERILALFARA